MIIVMEPLRETICKNFNRLRKERAEALTDEEIADKVGVTRGMVAKWKKGAVPEPENIEELSKIFRVDPIEFYKSEENVMPVYGASSLRTYLVIPDEIMGLVAKLNGHEPEVWDGVKGVLEFALADQERKRLSAKSG